MSGLSQAQLQAAAATQRLIVSAGAPGQAKTMVAGTATVSKTFSPAQLQIIRQATFNRQVKLQPGSLTAQAVKTTTIAGQPAVQVQFTQAQSRTQVSQNFYFKY